MTAGGQLSAEQALGNFSKRDIAMTLARVNLNGFTLTDEGMRPVGVGLFPFAAMLNHADRCSQAALLTCTHGIVLFAMSNAHPHPCTAAHVGNAFKNA